MLAQDSIIRQPFFIAMISALIIGCSIILYIQHTFETMIQEKIKENDQKTLDEKTKLASMDCKSLGNWLIQDDWWDRDNLRWAQNHYLVNCK